MIIKNFGSLFYLFESPITKQIHFIPSSSWQCCRHWKEKEIRQVSLTKYTCITIMQRVKDKIKDACKASASATNVRETKHVEVIYCSVPLVNIRNLS